MDSKIHLVKQHSVSEQINLKRKYKQKLGKSDSIIVMMFISFD